MAAQGFRACKFDPFQHTSYWYGDHLQTNLGLTEEQKALAIERLKAVQAAVGSGFPIAIETHAMLNGPTAVEMARRIHEAGIRCLWYEEPAGPEHPDAIADIRRQIPIPVCVGERVHSRFQALPVLQKQAADILMPDITRCGGVSEMRKIAALAETFNVPVAPHNPNGPISTIASAHVMAAIPNFFLQEFMVQDVPWRDEILDRPLPVRNGVFHLDDRPGLGFELNVEAVEKHPGVVSARPGFYV
jgi:galactonate dehydratase